LTFFEQATAAVQSIAAISTRVVVFIVAFIRFPRRVETGHCGQLHLADNFTG